jgi:hypothetical protein
MNGFLHVTSFERRVIEKFKRVGSFGVQGNLHVIAVDNLAWIQVANIRAGGLSLKTATKAKQVRSRLPVTANEPLTRSSFTGSQIKPIKRKQDDAHHSTHLAHPRGITRTYRRTSTDVWLSVWV